MKKSNEKIYKYIVLSIVISLILLTAFGLIVSWLVVNERIGQELVCKISKATICLTSFISVFISAKLCKRKAMVIALAAAGYQGAALMIASLFIKSCRTFTSGIAISVALIIIGAAAGALLPMQKKRRH